MTPGAVFPVQPPLSQAERVVDTFIAPSKTFTDILRSSSWWLPLILMILGSVAVSWSVNRQVGFERVAENQIHASPKTEARMAEATPDQRARQMKIQIAITKGITYAFPVALLISFALYALILWASFNFMLGAQTTYPQVFAVCFYAALPYLIRSVLTVITLFVGGNAEAYDYKNPVGTNPGFYLGDAAPWLRALLQRLDIIELWSLVLVILGMAIISRKSIAQSTTVVLAYWLLATLLAVGGAALS